MGKSLIGLLLVLCLCSQPAFSANTPKVGSACNKKGSTKTYKGQDFKCLMKGGKLVWSNSKVKSKETSVAAREVLPGVPSNQSIDDRERAFNSLRKIYDASRDRVIVGKVKLVAHPSTKSSDVSEIKSRFNDIMKFFGDDSANESFYVILGNMEFLSWSTQELKKIQPNNSSVHDSWENWLKSQLDSNNRCNAWNAGSHGVTAEGLGLISITLPPNDCTNPKQVVWKTTIEHEVVNHLQIRWLGDRTDLIPCWLSEGQAVYYGSALGIAKNFSEFKEVFAWHKRFKREDLMTAAKRLGHGIDGGTCGTQGGYEAGRLLVEQLIIEFGHQDLMSYTKSIVNTPGQDSEKWKVAFEQRFKVSYEMWLEKAVPEIVKRES